MNNKIKCSEVCLVVPPMSVYGTPSLALGILKAILIEAGISCRVEYADVTFGNALGKKLVNLLNPGSMCDYFGEYIFAEFAGITPAINNNELRFNLGKTMQFYGIQDTERKLYQAKEICREELEKTVDRILSYEPKVVGITSVFQQRNAALSIAKRIKEKRPEVRTFMGGPNCFGDAGLRLLKTYDFIDYVFFGESDGIFAESIKIIMEDNNEPLPYGVLRRTDPLPEIPPHRIEMNMDDIPYPDYDDFFELLSTDQGKFVREILNDFPDGENELSLLLEGSRGCWWGEKCACTFCGLHGNIREYRMKNPDRFFDEVLFMTEKYGIKNIVLTDCVMPKEWFDGFLQKLRDYPVDFSLFAETRTTMTEEQIKLMSDAGFKWIQPGIESLSNNSLQVMRKGTTAINNIHFLKCAEKYGIASAWNVLYGFPGETPEDFEEQTKLAGLLTHLKPPNGSASILIARENEYYNHKEQYGMELSPADFYKYICPDDPEYMNDIALVFDITNKCVSQDEFEIQRKLGDAIRAWTDEYKSENRPRLEMCEYGSNILILDTRSCRDLRAQLLVGIEKDIYCASIHPVTVKELTLAFAGKYDEAQIINAINVLSAKKLLYNKNNRVLALAIHRTLDEMKWSDIKEFRRIYDNNMEFQDSFDYNVTQRVKQGMHYDDAFAETLSEYAKRLHLCFNGVDYLKAPYDKII